MLRHQVVGEPGSGFAAPVGRGTTRDGRNPVERKAVARVRREIAAMPASLVVQLALWPDEIAPWARTESTSESLVYNMLARRKPYLRVRERLAERLEVLPAILAHLVDAKRPLPMAKRGPQPPDGAIPDGAIPDGAIPDGAIRGSGRGWSQRAEGTGTADIDWGRPPYPQERDGSNPIERRAVRVVERDIASMPASAVVGLALWPTTLAEWSREHRLQSSLVWATLAGSPSERVRAELAQRLDVTRRDLDDLIAAARAQPGATRTPGLDADRAEPAGLPDDVAAPTPPPAPTAPTDAPRSSRLRLAGEEEESDTAARALRSPAPPDLDQLTLGF